MMGIRITWRSEECREFRFMIFIDAPVVLEAHREKRVDFTRAADDFFVCESNNAFKSKTRGARWAEFHTFVRLNDRLLNTHFEHLVHTCKLLFDRHDATTSSLCLVELLL